MILTMLGVLLLLQSPIDSARQPREARSSSASVEGVVVRAGSGEPLAKAQVTLTRTGDGGSDWSSRSNPPSTTTGPDGRFVLRGIEPGSYRITVARNGYARQEYGQRVFGGQGTVVALAAGQAMRGIAFHLMPTGAVTGVVRDPSGEPLVGANVQVLRATYNAAGQRTLQPAGGDRTNDRGEYRVYWVTPGRYYVAVNGAAPGRATAAPGGIGSVNEIIERRYPTSYYPGTADVAQASAVDVAPGADITTVDILVPDQDLFRVTGRIVDPVTGRPPSTAVVSVAARGPVGAAATVTGSAQSYNPATGIFDLRDVAPGSYWIRAIATANSAEAILPPDAGGRSVADAFADSFSAGRQVAQAALDVFGNVDEVLLTLGSGVAIRGVISVEDQPLTALDGFDRIQVTLPPTSRGLIVNPSRHEPLGDDGVFTLPNVLPGEYAVAVHALPPGYYVKEARAGKIDVLDGSLLVSGPATGTLNLVLSRKSGQVQGVVVDEKRQPAVGVEVVLVPARRPARVDRYKTAVTDQSGAFTMSGIAPGDYRIFAWEAIESFAYFDENLLRLSDQQGVAVHVEESSRERVEVALIPARRP
jgi:carboxypeptidase family protein